MRRRIANVPWQATTLLGVCVMTIASAEAIAGSFYAAGSVRYVLCDDGFGSEDVFDEVSGVEGRTEMSLSAAYAYPNGNNVEARTAANLATGRLRTYAWAQYADPNPFWFSRAETRSRFRDGLLFELEPGHYEDGAVVSVSGHLGGLLQSIGTFPGTHATVTCQANFHGREFEFYSRENSLVDETFELSAALITPGSTLTETLEVPVAIYASLYTEAQVRVNEVSSAQTDFGGTFGFTQVEVPQGVSWTSESGVFLAIPEPSTLVLLSMGAVVLAVCTWQKRGRDRQSSKSGCA